MTTHILEVAERMADRIGVISRGRLIAEGSLEELRRQVNHQAGAAAGNAEDTGGASLEDTFLALVAEQAEAA
jgi:ABC-2 type transport system ATP-binding protein